MAVTTSNQKTALKIPTPPCVASLFAPSPFASDRALEAFSWIFYDTRIFRVGQNLGIITRFETKGKNRVWLSRGKWFLRPRDPPFAFFTP